MIESRSGYGGGDRSFSSRSAFGGGGADRDYGGTISSQSFHTVGANSIQIAHFRRVKHSLYLISHHSRHIWAISHLM